MTLRIGACLSLTGTFARFGTQAAHALQAWATFEPEVEVVIQDDASDTDTLRARLPSLADDVDLLLGPYATNLAAAAAEIATGRDLLLWNHGGSGDRVQTGWPGQVVSVLTPTSRYAHPYLDHLAQHHDSSAVLLVARGRGAFGRHIATGAHDRATELGLAVVRVEPDDDLGAAADLHARSGWHVLTAGRFEHDLALVAAAQSLQHPPRTQCAVAAGVREFADHIHPEGIYGIAQWRPGINPLPEIGPGEDDFLRAYRQHSADLPDYPAVQAAATAALATHCARHTTVLTRDALWHTATTLTTSTLFGRYAIDPTTGAQIGHRTTLVQWQDGVPIPVDKRQRG